MGKKKRKEPSRVAKTGNGKGRLLFWKLLGALFPSLCERYIACVLLLFPSNICFWLCWWNRAFAGLLSAQSFYQDHPTRIFLLSSLSEGKKNLSCLSFNGLYERGYPAGDEDKINKKQKP